MALRQDNEGDIDLTDNDITISELGNVLDQILGEVRPASPTTPEPASPAVLEETEYLSGTRRNTMTTHQTGECSTPAPAMPEITQDQLQQIIQSLSRGTRKPKIKEPDTYRRERHKLRGWLAQLQVYFKAIKWAEEHDDEKILYAISLLRDDAGKWITPYTEELIPSLWENWAGFAQEFQSQFGVIDAKGEVRITLKNMKQGRKSMTEYWNEFRLVASETGLDDSMAGEWLLGGMNPELQNAWGASSNKYTNITALTNWAIEKVTRLATVRHIQGHKTTTPIQKQNEIPRNPNGTYQPRTTTQGGEPMDLDAFRQRPRLNISQEEFRRRMREKLCLKCAQPGYQADVCTRQDQPKQFNPRASNWQPVKRNAPWQLRQKIQEMEVEKEPEQSGNGECHQ